jgi:CRISPR-associated protein Csm1
MEIKTKEKNEMSYFSNENRFKYLIEKPKDISYLLEDKMLLISGDFYGIQKFIFDRLSTKNASKVLRAKSAYIQIFTEYLARYICSELKISENSIISMNAGKFEILSSKMDIDLDVIQKTVDDFFVKNFYGLSGVMISSVICQRDDLSNTKQYKALRKKIIDSVEDKKFQKFNLFKEDAYDVLSYDTNLDNSSLCPICNIRKAEAKKENCSICDGFIELGEKLSFEHIDELVDSDKLGMKLDNFVIDIELSSKLKSYILFDGRSPAEFKLLADNSCKNLETGIKSLAILKADVDNMGKFLEKSDVTDSFENFDTFSKTMDSFFSVYIPQKLMKEKYPNSYTVFAGGDDLFLLGAWDEILEMAREIESEFKAFVKSDALSISFGIAIAKPSTPISYLADYTEHLLEDAKGIDEEKEVEYPKDAISLFRETVKWKTYKKTYAELYGALEDFEEHLNTAFLYRLLEFIEMSKKVKYSNDIPSTMWKSKFRYSFNRNVLEKMRSKEQRERAEKILNLLSGLIDESPKETKMVINEFIYKRRAS